MNRGALPANRGPAGDLHATIDTAQHTTHSSEHSIIAPLQARYHLNMPTAVNHLSSLSQDVSHQNALLVQLLEMLLRLPDATDLRCVELSNRRILSQLYHLLHRSLTIIGASTSLTCRSVSSGIRLLTLLLRPGSASIANGANKRPLCLQHML